MGLFGPFGALIERLGDMLTNKAMEEVFGNSDAARSTRVIIYNHTDQNLFLLATGFESGGFSTGATAPGQIEPKSVVGYKVESHGFATGVTGADTRYGFVPGDPQVRLWIVTSNPFAGDNSWNAVGFAGVMAQATGSVGNNNEVDVDVWPA